MLDADHVATLEDEALAKLGSDFATDSTYLQSADPRINVGIGKSKSKAFLYLFASSSKQPYPSLWDNVDLPDEKKPGEGG